MPASAVLTKPITRSRLHEEIVSIIQKQIMNGTIIPGAKLPTEREMAKNLQCKSHNPASGSKQTRKP